MDTPTPAASHEVRARAATLHREVHVALGEQFAAALEDLQQLRSILGDATTKLSQAFHTMIRQAEAQGAAAARLDSASHDVAVAELRELAADISRGSRLVVQSLQFEDMASQLLQHVDRRLAWLEGFSKEAAPLHNAVAEDIVGLSHVDFGSVEQRLAEHRSRMQAHKSVRQESLDEGDVELF